MKSLVPRKLALPLFFVLLLAVSNLMGQAPAGNPSSASAAPAAAASASSNPGDPLLDVPPLPRGKVSFVGGNVAKVDTIRNHMTVEPFGTHTKMKIAFDERTHIYRDGVETTQAAIHKGDRVYVDTMLDGPRVFARNVRVVTQVTPADASGQVTAFDSRSGMMTVQDQLSGQQVTFAVTPQTSVKNQDNKPASTSALQPGTLVSVRFSPTQGKRGEAREVAVLAVPGTAFTFVGKVVHLDLRSGLLAVDNQSDDKTYDISFDPATSQVKNDLRLGAQVVVVATFTGNGYKASSININQ